MAPPSSSPDRIAGDPVPEDPVLAQRIRAERIRFMHVQSLLPIFFSPVAAIVLCAALWQRVDHVVLQTFAAGQLALMLVRLDCARRWPGPLADARRLGRWESWCILTITLVDLWWGFGALTLVQPSALFETTLVFAFVMLMAGGHAASYAAHGLLVTLGVLALTLPLTLWLAWMADRYHGAMAFVAIMFLAATFRSIRTLRFFFDRSYRLAHELEHERQRAEALASTDVLSGLKNRRAFYEAATASITLADAPSVLLLLDIDHFKRINDTHGHAGGDAVIRAVGQELAALVANGGLAGRVGGEEFAVLLTGLTAESVVNHADALLGRLRALSIVHAGGSIRCTASAGLAAHLPSETIETLVGRADAALYAAKRAGRDRWLWAEPVASPPQD